MLLGALQSNLIFPHTVGGKWLGQGGTSFNISGLIYFFAVRCVFEDVLFRHITIRRHLSITVRQRESIWEVLMFVRAQFFRSFFERSSQHGLFLGFAIRRRRRRNAVSSRFRCAGDWYTGFLCADRVQTTLQCIRVTLWWACALLWLCAAGDSRSIIKTRAFLVYQMFCPISIHYVSFYHQ